MGVKRTSYESYREKDTDSVSYFDLLSYQALQQHKNDPLEHTTA